MYQPTGDKMPIHLNPESIFDDEYTEEELIEIAKSFPKEIQELISYWESTLDELEVKYFNGDRDMYPPSWYDNFCYPLRYSIDVMKRILEDIT